MKCFHPMCTVRAPQGTLFRVNAKGQPGIWACRIHIKNTDTSVDPEVARLAGLIDGSLNGKGNV